jgi:hypothetical protein
MLFTAGFSPVAHEFSGASAYGSLGFVPTPVAPECPSTAIESSSGVDVRVLDEVVALPEVEAGCEVEDASAPHAVIASSPSTMAAAR